MARAKDCAAVIYSPGLFEKEDGRSLAHFAERLARALDQQSPEVTARFEARPAVVERYADGASEVEVREIVRTAPGEASEVTHRVYFLDYQEELEAVRGESNWLTEAWALGSTLWVMGVRYLVHARGARSLSRNQKVATTLAGAALALLMAYFAWMVKEGIGALAVDAKAAAAPTEWFWSAMDWAAGVLSPVTRWWAGAWLDRLVGWSVDTANAWSAWLEAWDAWLVTAGLGVFSFKRVRAELARGLSLFVMTARYFIAGRGRAACTGRFNDLLEHVAEENAGRIDVVGYSMGSLVALDALFPWRGLPRGRGQRVGSLTTIGCPFDFVRAFWPVYFEGREAGAAGTKWVNVFSPVDLLGSNFTNTGGVPTKATRGINAASPRMDDSVAARGEEADPNPGAGVAAGAAPSLNVCYDYLGRTELRWTDALTFEAFAAHSQYWVRGDARAESCLGAVVAAVYFAKTG